MKILLLGFAKLKIMPYASFYLENIDCKKNDVSLLYWNRDLLDEDKSKYKDIRLIEFACFQEDSVPKKQKIISFLQYRHFALREIRKGNYDFIISLHTIPGLLVLDKLLFKYKRKYILDYRDSTSENNWLFGACVNKLAANSRVVFVSSDGFRRFLPEDGVEIITSHNILTDSLNHRDDRNSGYIRSEKIRIAFWGLLRHTKHNEMIIDRLANDTRFELHYYGREQATGKKLRGYCESNNIKNVFFHGEYKPEDRYQFIKQTDLIHNNYLDNNMLLAMGNKYYDGIIFRIPQICMIGSLMGELCDKYGVGASVDPHNVSFANDVYHYYKGIDWHTFEGNCDTELNRVMAEYNYGKKIISHIFN